jgi:D-alanyl-D-alanine carboxypeptidase (penicillin-binding protein 5/6)
MTIRYLYVSLILVCSLQAKSLEFDVKAKSAILINADTGVVLYEKNAHSQTFPASITKIATALFVLEHASDLSHMVSVSAESVKFKPNSRDGASVPAYWLEWDGTRMGLQRGELLSVETLLHGLMLISGNDAANVLAESVSGSVPLFLEELNAYVGSLGCQSTCFLNPHGLHHEEHATTAYDMALVSRKALQHPKFCEIVSTLEYLRPRTNKQPEAQIRQTNPLLKQGNRFYYPKAIGIKTGYTSKAQNTLVAAAKDQGRTLIAVLLGCEKRDDRYTDAKKLFEAAFNEQKMRRLFFSKNQAYLKKVEGAKKDLTAYLEEEAAIEFYPAEETDMKAYIYWEIPPFPIRKDQKVGEMRFVDVLGNQVLSVSLLATEDVKATLFFALKERWNRLFSSSK